MDIIFANKKLEKLANNYTKSIKKLGNERAALYQQRLSDLSDVESFHELQYLPGKYHALKATRKGQWACSLDHPYRLIFEPATHPIPVNEHGAPVLSEIKIVGIIEITDYH